MSNIYHTWKTSFTEEVGRHYFKVLGCEKGVYGMYDNDENRIVYVGEATDITYRVWQHFHDFRFGGNLNLFHNSFLRHAFPDLFRPITQEDAEVIIKEVHKRYNPIILYAQKEDGQLANLERCIKELEFIKKYHPRMNVKSFDKRLRHKQNPFTNELGRYEKVII